MEFFNNLSEFYYEKKEGRLKIKINIKKEDVTI